VPVDITRSMKRPVIRSVSSAVPSHKHLQGDVYEAAKALFAERGQDLSPFKSAFINTAIDSRYSAVPLSWFFEKHTWTDRNAVYIKTSLDLLETCALKAMKKASIDPQDVTDLLLLSTTGIATPSLEAQLMDRIPFRSDVRRTPIFGLGCAGGLMGLNRAASLAEHPSRTVLVLVVELCTLNFMRDELSKQNVIATALFADGAAAAVIQSSDLVSGSVSGSKQVTVSAQTEHRWPNSLDIMGWDVADEGLKVIFSRKIPDLVKNDFRPVMHSFLERERRPLSEFKNFLCHPGGAKVIDELESVFQRPAGQMIESREILKNFGNMSAPTVLFVLEKAMDQGLQGPSLLSTFGPGFTTAMTILEGT
jgi:alkylresorcinol/alkylpyrone synthase